MARGQVPSPEAFAKNFGAAGVQTFNSPLGSTPRFVRVLFFVFFCDTTKIRLTECLCSWFIREIGVRFEYIKLYLFRKEPFRGEWELFFFIWVSQKWFDSAWLIESRHGLIGAAAVAETCNYERWRSPPKRHPIFDKVNWNNRLLKLVKMLHSTTFKWKRKMKPSLKN